MMDKLKLVKTIVFIITFLLVFGSVLLLGALYQKLHRPAAESGEILSLGEPDGSTIKQMELQNDTLYLLVKDGGLPDRIIIYNKTAGQPARLNIN